MTEPPEKKLAELQRRLQIVGDIERAQWLLVWDEKTTMPPAGAPARADQLATLARVEHEMRVDDELWELIAGLGEWATTLEPDSEQAATVRVARRDAQRARAVPPTLRAEIAHATSVGENAWAEARRRSDFAAALPHLERQISLTRQVSDCYPDAAHPYDPLLERFEPGATTAWLEPLLGELRAGLEPLLAAVIEGGGRRDDSGVDAPLEWRHDAGSVEALVRELVAEMPLRDGAWRVDGTESPFAVEMGPNDVRIAIAANDDDLHSSLYAGLHEGGHALYDAGIPASLPRGVLGRAASLSLHESQSRLWENQVGRSRAYLARALPRMRAHLGPGFAPEGAEQLYRAANAAGPTPIRIHADEITYNLHILLRFELELALVGGELEARDLPQAWNERTRELLGLEVREDAEGVLQDPHWFGGDLGYFPTYAIGNIVAGHLWELAAEELGDLDELIAAGELRLLGEFLGRHVHRHGARLTLSELAESEFGGPLTAAPLLRYLSAKFGPIYGF